MRKLFAEEKSSNVKPKKRSWFKIIFFLCYFLAIFVGLFANNIISTLLNSDNPPTKEYFIFSILIWPVLVYFKLTESSWDCSGYMLGCFPSGADIIIALVLQIGYIYLLASMTQIIRKKFRN